MAQPISVLILDDNETIGGCIKRRLLKANEAFSNSTDIEINPVYLPIDIADINVASKKIESCLLENKIDFLLLDRGFYKLFDPVKINDANLDKGYLYIKKDDDGIIITEILSHVNFSRITKLKGVILYTYDDPSRTNETDSYTERAEIKKELKDSIGDKVGSDNIEVVLTNSEIYNLASLDLYEVDPKQINDYLRVGKKSDFMLYGLFIGEILYHRIIRTIDKQQRHNHKTKKSRAKARLLLLFIVFTALSIGGSAIYSLLLKELKSDFSLLLLSIVFSLVFPLLILILKPDWILSLETDNSDKNEI